MFSVKSFMLCLPTPFVFVRVMKVRYDATGFDAAVDV